ncbi:MAG TPA: hypothetical protein VGP87_05955 [Gemmatimonadales bacterium]|nr:hypothetical protein [Gemmatimonadales bacterium]
MMLTWYALALIAHSAPGSERIPFIITERALDIRVDYGQRSLAGTETLTLRNVSSRAAVTVPLLLNRLMSISRAGDEKGAKLRYTQDVVLFEDDSALQVTAAAVTLAGPVAPGDSTRLVIHFGGHLVGYVETGSLYIRDRVDSAFTILREDAFAFPALGVPSRRVNRAMGSDHVFGFTARVTVPAGQVVATGGEALEPVRIDSLVTWTYRSVLPAPVLNIAIAPYRTLTRAGLRIFYFPEDSTGAGMVDRAVAGAMTQLTGWYGPLGQDGRLTVIEIPEGWGSQASLAGGIIETADAFRDRSQLYQLYHELSHLWNVPDRDRPSPRWNEGLAMFLQWRLASALDGWSAWEARLDRMEQRLNDDCRRQRSCGSVPFADYGMAELTGLSYSVGMAMFYALYQTLGADGFDRAYRSFFQQHGTGGTTADLIAAFHAVNPAGDRIFAEWYGGTGWYDRLLKGERLTQIVQGYPH